MSSVEEEIETTTTSFQSMIAHMKENPVAYAVGVLILQQLGWLAQATSHVQGMCF